MYDKFLQNLLVQQALYVTDPDNETIFHPSSIFDRILFVLGTLRDTFSTIQNRFPQKNPTNRIQKS